MSTPNWYKKNEPLTENRSVEINKYKFNHYSIPSVPQTNNVNLWLRLRMTLERFSFKNSSLKLNDQRKNDCLPVKLHSFNTRTPSKLHLIGVFNYRNFYSDSFESIIFKSGSFCVSFFVCSKGPITWWVSALAEISLRPAGWNIVVITCSISARGQNANFPEKVYWFKQEN